MIRKWMLLVLAALLVTSTSAGAQQTDEPLLGELIERFRTRALRIQVLLQILGDFQEERAADEGTSGFTIPRARFSVRGELDGGISYAVEADMVRNPLVNDAWIRKTFHPAIAVDMGQFKAPFSGERLQSSSQLEFINRSQIVRALAPGRNVGVALRGQFNGTGLGYFVGAFNGNAQRLLINDNNELMYAGRVTYRTNPFGGDAPNGIEVGVNAVRSHDEAVTLGYSLGTTFTGIRTLYGADFRVECGPLLFNGEYIGSRLENSDDDITSEPSGYQASISYRVATKHRLHFRWDSIEGDGLRTDRDLGIVGWSYQMTTPTKLQMNLVLPSGEGRGRQQLLTQMQLFF